MSGASGLRKHDHSSAGQGGTGVVGSPADILDVATAETDTTLVLAPDGAGGVEFRAEAGGSGGFDPTTQAFVYDDCWPYAYDNTDLFDGGIKLFASGTDSGMLNSSLGTVANHPGIVDLTTGTDTTGYAALWSQREISQLASLSFGAVLRLNSTSNGTNRFAARFGAALQLPIDDTSGGVFFSYSDNVNSGKWLANVIDNGLTAHTADTGISADTSWHRFEFVTNSANNSTDFSIDGSIVATVAATHPDPTGTITYMTPGCIVKSLGTSQRRLMLDVYWYSWVVTR